MNEKKWFLQKVIDYKDLVVLGLYFIFREKVKHIIKRMKIKQATMIFKYYNLTTSCILRKNHRSH